MRLVNPTFGISVQAQEVRPTAPRDAEAPKRIALLSNAKPNVAELLQLIAEKLPTESTSSHASYTKDQPSIPARDDVLDQFDGTDLAIVGVGD